QRDREVQDQLAHVLPPAAVYPRVLGGLPHVRRGMPVHQAQHLVAHAGGQSAAHDADPRARAGRPGPQVAGRPLLGRREAEAGALDGLRLGGQARRAGLHDRGLHGGPRRPRASRKGRRRGWLLLPAQGKHEPLREAGQGVMALRLGPLRIPWPGSEPKDPYWDAFINRPVSDPRNLTQEALRSAGGAVNPTRADLHSPEITSDHLKQLAKFLGAELVGIVQLTGAEDRDEADADSYPFAIVCAVRTDHDPRTALGVG